MLSPCKIVTFGAGWRVAPGDADDIRVCGAHAWQSTWLVLADGSRYGTAMCNIPSKAGACSHVLPPPRMCCRRLTRETGKRYDGGGFLVHSPQGAHSAHGYADVLLRRISVSPPDEVNEMQEMR